MAVAVRACWWEVLETTEKTPRKTRKKVGKKTRKSEKMKLFLIFAKKRRKKVELFDQKSDPFWRCFLPYFGSCFWAGNGL